MSIARLMQLAASGGTEAGGWDISNATFSDPPSIFPVYNQELTPNGISFSSDGANMYIIGSTGDDVNQYSLSTAWDITTASYLQVFSVSAQTTTPTSVFFKPDGTKMYVIDTSFDSVFEYDIATAWSINTASYVQSFSVSAYEASPTGLFFKPDGTKMYVVGTAGDDVNEFDLSTAWDVSTASFSQVSASVVSQVPSVNDVFFKSDGTKMYLVDLTNDNIVEYGLSTAWDVSTISYSQSFNVSSEETSPSGVFFKSDGTQMYVVGSNNRAVFEYDLGTAWDVSTAVLNVPGDNWFGVGGQDISPLGFFFKPDGTKMYVTGSSSDYVNEYDLGTAWSITTASFLQRFYVGTQDTSPTDIFFKPDGTKMYMLGAAGDDVNEYDLSTAWDVSTASYLQVFSVAAQELGTSGLYFKPDGTKMYVVGTIGDDVNEYDLSTAWDVSTASYLQSFSVASQETLPYGIDFKPDGTKMYVVGTIGDDVNEYSLSTAWDVSTASYVQNFSVVAQTSSPSAIRFRPDGLQMYILDGVLKAILKYDLV